MSRGLFAQVPQGIPYQSIIRNSAGNVAANQSVKLRFSIHDSIAAGTVVYQETFQTSTNSLGLTNVNIGMGTAVIGTFASINWGENSKFMQVEIDATGGTNFTDMGTTQMMSVPYALYSGISNNSLNVKNRYLAIGTTDINAGNNQQLTDMPEMSIDFTPKNDRIIVSFQMSANCFFCANYQVLLDGVNIGGDSWTSNVSNISNTNHHINETIAIHVLPNISHNIKVVYSTQNNYYLTPSFLINKPSLGQYRQLIVED